VPLLIEQFALLKLKRRAAGSGDAGQEKAELVHEQEVVGFAR